MLVSYSELINRFGEALGITREMIQETFNKPDATEIVMNRYVSVKMFGDMYILIVYEMSNAAVRFLNAYRIYPKLLEGVEIYGMKPLGILKEFMDRYGMGKEIPGFGEKKFFVDRTSCISFFGILDIEKYMEAVNGI